MSEGDQSFAGCDVGDSRGQLRNSCISIGLWSLFSRGRIGLLSHTGRPFCGGRGIGVAASGTSPHRGREDEASQVNISGDYVYFYTSNSIPTG